MRRVVYIALSLVFAFIVLGTSLFRTAQPDFAFYQPADSYSQKGFVSPVEYYLPYHGMLPDHRLWPLKAVRDKVWVELTRDPIKRAQLLLLFSDKRLGMAEELFKKAEGDLGVATILKAEQYLDESFKSYEEAEIQGMDTADFLQKLARASLKHREGIEGFASIAPNDAKPVLIETLNIPKILYEKSVQELNRKGIDLPSESSEN